MRKAKVIKKEIVEKLNNGVSDIEIYKELAEEFLLEFASMPVENNTINKIHNLAKELDMKFQSCVDDEHIYYRYLFRNIVLEQIPELKKDLLW